MWRTDIRTQGGKQYVSRPFLRGDIIITSKDWTCVDPQSFVRWGQLWHFVFLKGQRGSKYHSLQVNNGPTLKRIGTSIAKKPFSRVGVRTPVPPLDQCMLNRLCQYARLISIFPGCTGHFFDLIVTLWLTCLIVKKYTRITYQIKGYR